jgi:biopolymer transport protein ExbD
MSFGTRGRDDDGHEHPHTIVPLVAAVAVVLALFAVFFVLRATGVLSDGPTTKPTPSVTAT